MELGVWESREARAHGKDQKGESCTESSGDLQRFSLET